MEPRQQARRRALRVGQQIEVTHSQDRSRTKKISLGLKQLQPNRGTPSPQVPGRPARPGAVTRLADFGAFVELEPGVEGLIHVSEMSWGKKMRTPSDMVKPGDTVDAVILGIKPEEQTAFRSA